MCWKSAVPGIGHQHLGNRVTDGDQQLCTEIGEGRVSQGIADTGHASVPGTSVISGLRVPSAHPPALLHSKGNLQLTSLCKGECCSRGCQKLCGVSCCRKCSRARILKWGVSRVLQRSFSMRLSGHEVICAGTAGILQRRRSPRPQRLGVAHAWEPCRDGFIVGWKPIQM